MNAKPYVRLPVTATALLMLLLSCSTPMRSSVSQGSGSPNSVSSAATAAAMKVGALVPDVRSEAIEGPPVRLTDFRGRPFLINFWASTCEPCVREFPLLLGALDRHSDLPIVGIDVLERKDAAMKFAKKRNATWPNIWDPDGSIAQNKFGVHVLPVTLAVGRNFKLVDRYFGELTRHTLDRLIEEIYRS